MVFAANVRSASSNDTGACPKKIGCPVSTEIKYTEAINDSSRNYVSAEEKKVCRPLSRFILRSFQYHVNSTRAFGKRPV